MQTSLTGIILLDYKNNIKSDFKKRFFFFVNACKTESINILVFPIQFEIFWHH